MNPHQDNVAWWVGLSRDEFAELRRKREQAMRDSRFGLGALYASLGDSVPRPRNADKEFAPRPKYERP